MFDTKLQVCGQHLIPCNFPARAPSGAPAVLTFFFLLFLATNKIAPQIRSLPLPTISFPLNYAWTIRSFVDAPDIRAKTSPLNQSLINMGHTGCFWSATDHCRAGCLIGRWTATDAFPLCDEQPCVKSYSPNIARVIKSRRMRWAGHVALMGEERGVYRVLVRKPEGKRPMGRPRRRWVDNIRMGLQEVGCGYMDWIGLAQDRDRWRTLASAVMNLRVPWNVRNFLTSCKPVSFSRRTLHHAVSMYFALMIFFLRLNLIKVWPHSEAGWCCGFVVRSCLTL